MMLAEGHLAGFEYFYAATVKRVLAVTRRAADSDHLAWDAAQEAYARMLELWPERRSFCLEDNRRYTMKIAISASKAGGLPPSDPLALRRVIWSLRSGMVCAIFFDRSIARVLGWE